MPSPDLVGFRTFQKIRYFLAGALPILARIGPPAHGRLARLFARFPRLTAAWQRLRHSRFGVVGERVASTFVFGHYTEDPLDWEALPGDARAVLRSSVVLAALLCLLVPLAMTWIWPSVTVATATGSVSAVAGWSVILWLLTVSLGWSALLAGTAAASRLAFLPSLTLFLYFSAAAVGALAKSWWSLLVPLQAIIALVYAELQPAASSRTARALLGRAAAIAMAGSLIAALTIVVIPTTPWFRGRLLVVSVACGIPLGILVRLVAARLARRNADAQPVWRMDVVTATLTITNMLLLASLVWRGGLAPPAATIHAFAMQATGFLWPFYFFVGAGVVFKILRQTSTVQRVVENALPASWFVPAALAMLVVATGIAWIKPILLRPAFPWPAWLLTAASALYAATAWLWQSALIRLAVDPMKWILLGTLVLAVYCASQRRLTSALMARLIFGVTLCAFVVVEYHFQSLGFIRSPRASAFSLLVFTALILWLVHRTAFPYLTRASGSWPARSRLALYGALLMFALFPIHARAALHDPRLTNELFLYLFLGAINFGVPFYIFLYARKRLDSEVWPAASAFASVLVGAACSVALIVADKIVAAGSLAAAWAFAGQQTAALAEGGTVVAGPLLPARWLLVRGVFVVGSLAAMGGLEWRRSAGSFSRAAFRVIGVAAGLVCFANRGIELPLMPQRVTFLIAPLHHTPLVDATYAATAVGLLLPALLLTLALGDPRRKATGLALVLLAYLSHVSTSLLWPRQEAWLRSTDTLVVGGIIALALLALLAIAVRDRVGPPGLGDEHESAPRASLLTWPELRRAAAGVMVIATVLGSWRALHNRLSDRELLSGIVLKVPRAWRSPISASGAGASLTRESWSGAGSRLVATTGAGGDTLSAAAVLRSATERSAGGIEPLSVSRWDRHYPGAIALDFRVNPPPDDAAVAGFGTMVAAPLPNGRTLTIEMRYDAGDVHRKWDVARALESLPR